MVSSILDDFAHESRIVEEDATHDHNSSKSTGFPSYVDAESFGEDWLANILVVLATTMNVVKETYFAKIEISHRHVRRKS